MKKPILVLLAIMIAAPTLSVSAQSKKRRAVPDEEHYMGCSISEEKKPKTVVDGVKYAIDPRSLKITMLQGEDAQFDLTIFPGDEKVYGFDVYGYGVGLPTYGILMNESSGGARGQKTIHGYVSGNILGTDGAKTKVYKGYLPVHIYHGSETGRDSNFIKLPFEITVKKKK